MQRVVFLNGPRYVYYYTLPPPTHRLCGLPLPQVSDEGLGQLQLERLPPARELS